MAKKPAKVKKQKSSRAKDHTPPKESKSGKAPATETEKLISSKVVFQGPLFRVLHDKLIEPGGKPSERDVIRHNGSVVILAVDKSKKNKKDPWIVMEHQYRHAAKQYLWELPAGKLEAGEDPLAGAQRELEEETGYRAKKWKPLVEYYASPGFLGESMKVFLAEGLVAGDAHPEDDEDIEFRLVKLSEVIEDDRKGRASRMAKPCAAFCSTRAVSQKNAKSEASPTSFAQPFQWFPDAGTAILVRAGLIF